MICPNTTAKLWSRKVLHLLVLPRFADFHGREPHSTILKAQFRQL